MAGFPGICRVHGAEILRLRGAWRDAELEATRACEELSSLAPGWVAEAFYQIGEVQLRVGNDERAANAFRQAHALGREPEPGASLLLMKQGRAQDALASIQHVEVAQSALAPIEQARILEGRVTIALAAGRPDIARQDVDALETLASTFATCAMTTLWRSAKGSLEAAGRDPAALRSLRHALRGWQELEAPYEAAMVRLDLASALRERGDLVGARRELESARAAFDRLGAVRDTLDADRRLGSLTEDPAPPEPALCCFMFTDIVGSTQLVDAIGDDAWTQLVSWHDRSLRACFSRFEGEELDHAGDGFFVSFTDAQSAIDCAICIQRTLRQHRREHGFAPRVRIGVHGAAARRVDNAYRGKGVHEAARIASLASGDEILASEDTVPAGLSTSNPRQLELRGISAPVKVVTVDWE